MAHVVRIYGARSLQEEYKNWKIGGYLPEDNSLSSGFLWMSSKQGVKYWRDLNDNVVVFSIDHYNALAEIFDESPFEEDINIEDFL